MHISYLFYTCHYIKPACLVLFYVYLINLSAYQFPVTEHPSCHQLALSCPGYTYCLTLYSQLSFSTISAATLITAHLYQLNQLTFFQINSCPYFLTLYYYLIQIAKLPFCKHYIFGGQLYT